MSFSPLLFSATLVSDRFKLRLLRMFMQELTESLKGLELRVSRSEREYTIEAVYEFLEAINNAIPKCGPSAGGGI